MTQALVNAINGEGTIVMTQGALGHTGAQGRAKGFHSVVSKFPKLQVLDEQPADWDVTKVARIWETLLTKYPKIDAAFFHNDDMALAALKVMEAKGRTETKVGGVDAMPPAIKAVQDGKMYATVRNPSCRIHGGAIVAGVQAVVHGAKTGKDIPKNIVTDAPMNSLSGARNVNTLIVSSGAISVSMSITGMPESIILLTGAVSVPMPKA